MKLTREEFIEIAEDSPMLDENKLAAKRVLVDQWAVTRVAEHLLLPPTTVSRAVAAIRKRFVIFTAGPDAWKAMSLKRLLGLWVEASLELGRKGDVVTGVELRADLAAWMRERKVCRARGDGFEPHRVGPADFGLYMRSIGVETEVEDGVTRYQKCRVKAPRPTEELAFCAMKEATEIRVDEEIRAAVRAEKARRKEFTTRERLATATNLAVRVENDDVKSGGDL